jgi:hypothetical protein
MRRDRYAFAFVALCVLFLSSPDVKAQTSVDYRFLEVLDADRKPVPDTRVETKVNGGYVRQTDDNGAIKDFALYGGDYNTTDVKASKQGYSTYEEEDFFAFYRRYVTRTMHNGAPRSDLLGTLLKGESYPFDGPPPLKIELLKLPATTAERQRFEVRLKEQELLKAVKHGDVATVRSLLGTGVSANTTDVYGLPAILLAVTAGDAEIIRALLAAGADVRSKDKAGRKALLYYLNFTEKPSISDALVRSLIDAGADVNAKRYDGATPLDLAKEDGDEKIIRLLESAGSKPK